MTHAPAPGTAVRPRAILFDWDNTLVDSWPVIHDVLNTTLTAFGLEPWTLEETRNRVRRSMRESFPALFGARWEEAGEFFYKHFAAVHLHNLQPRPGAERMLADLHAAGIYLGIVSNKNGKYLRREAEHLGWADYFGAIVGAFDAARDKPAPDPVRLALAGITVRPSDEVWFAGDANVDLECATNAGCVPVLVREGAPRPGEFDGHPPVWHFGECLALSNCVRRL